MFEDKQQKPWEPRVNLPEFSFKRNVTESKRKAVFVADTGKNSVEEAIEIAKDNAQKMGMGDKTLLKALNVSYDSKEKGWYVLVQKRI